MTPLIMPDALLDDLAEKYLATPWLRASMSFERFLLCPPGEFLPLLPRQRAVRDRLDAGQRMEIALGVSERQIARGSPVIRDGALVEKLKHHVWPKHAMRRVVREFSEEPAS